MIPSNKVPILGEFDTVVIGSGPAGIGAAIASARQGARTVLVERYGFMGGTMTAGLLNVLLGFFAKDKQVVAGIAQEIVERLSTHTMGTFGHQKREECSHCTEKEDCPNGSWKSFVSFNPEAMKIVAIEMAEDAGVHLLLHSLAVDAITEGNRIKGVVLVSKSGESAVKAKVVVDASGDADIAARAGAEYEKGRPEDGMMQMPTLVFTVGGVNRTESRIALRAFSEMERSPALEKAIEMGLHLPGRKCFIYRMPIPGQYSVNAVGVDDFDSTDAWSVTKAELETRKNIYPFVDFLKRNIPGFESCYLVETASQVSPRESRRIMGEYVLTADDVLSAKKFSDGVVNGVHPIDIHHRSTASVSAKNYEGLPCSCSYNIPYRCLLPKAVENLLVVGRCISCTHEALGSVRVMATSIGMGQAAGTAAAMCLEGGYPPRAVSAGLLRDRLSEQSVVV